MRPKRVEELDFQELEEDYARQSSHRSRRRDRESDFGRLQRYSKMLAVIGRCTMLLNVSFTDSWSPYGDMLVTTSGILQEQKFSKPRSIG
jgi:hypothetical protein